MRQFIQKYAIEIYNAIGGGVVGFISSKVFETWIQPVLITAICAIISLLISHFGRRRLEGRHNVPSIGGGYSPVQDPAQKRDPDTKLKKFKKNDK